MKPTLKKLVTALATVLVYVFMAIFWAGVSSLLARELLMTDSVARTKVSYPGAVTWSGFRAQCPKFRRDVRNWGLGSTSNYRRSVLLGYGTMSGN
jgi:hypothetical protein